MDLINVSNAKIIEKTGIEIITKLNKQQLEQAEQIILKKNRPFGTPQRVRNIFLFDAYTDLSSAQPEEIFPVAD